MSPASIAATSGGPPDDSQAMGETGSSPRSRSAFGVVQKLALRATIVAILAALALFIYVNRVPLEACARTCECTIADRHVNVPICEPGSTS